MAVRGVATPDEVVAVLAALARRRPAPPAAEDGYERWRRGRLVVTAREVELSSTFGPVKAL